MSHPWSSGRRGAFAALCALVIASTLSIPRPASAQPAPPPGVGTLVPVIEAGREGDVAALVAPHGFDASVVPGWRLAGARIDRSAVAFLLEGPDGARAALHLTHPTLAPDAVEATASFALRREGDDGATAALDALVAAVRRNDGGGFWTAEGAHGLARRSGWERFTTFLVELVGDNAFYATLAFLFFLVFLARQLRGAPRWVPLALGAVVVAGAVVRAVIAVDVTMAAWGYSRYVPAASWVAGSTLYGPLLARLHGGPVPYVAIVSWTNFGLAVLAPAFVFAHARAFLRSDRAALIAAALLAFLPAHIRFARSDVLFMQSLALSSYVFALLYGVLHERSRAWFVATLAALVAVLAGVFVVRPLNVLFFPFFLYPVWLGTRPAAAGPDGDGGAAAPSRGRRALLTAVVTGAFVWILVVVWLPTFGSTAGEALASGFFRRIVTTFVSVTHNTFLNPTVTPLGITALALLGLVVLWREGAPKRALFLALWFGTFFAAHAAVVVDLPEMQARYHLHLVVPFVLMAAPAAAALVRWNAWAGVAVGLYVVAAPALHLGFERSVDFDVMHEWRFLQRVRSSIPPGCTVLEYGGLEEIPDLRLERFGFEVSEEGRGFRWDVVSTGRAATGAAARAPAADDPAPVARRWSRGTIEERAELRPESFPEGAPVLSDAARAVVTAPPSCLFVYEGLPCWAYKPVDAPIAPPCAAVREVLALEPLSHVTFDHRPYDPNATVGVSPDSGPLTLRLYRARPNPPAPPEAAAR